MEMEEVEVTFEREGRKGLVATGSYLIDAAGRLGIRFEDVCVQAEGTHFCSVTIRSGADNLSALTQLETEHFSKNGRKNNERLACQAKIEKPGEVIIMTEEKKEETKSENEESDQYVKDFTELPLEKKIAKLAKLEVIALGETISYVINSPFTVGEKVLDVLAEFGFKKEQRAKEATRPAEGPAAGQETPPPSAGKAGKAGKKHGKKAGDHENNQPL
jgi:ferredoxin